MDRREVNLPMVCRHGEHEDGALQTIQRAREVLELEAGQHFVSGVVYNLCWRWGAEIAGIECDQWARVTVHTWRSNESDPVAVRVECDLVEDGLAAIVCWFKDNREEVE